MFEYIIIGVIIVVIVSVCILITNRDIREEEKKYNAFLDKQKKRRQQDDLEWEEYQKREAKRKQDYALTQERIREQFGEPDKSIILEPFCLEKEIRAYSSIRKVFILGKELSFEDVLECRLSDDCQIQKGETTITSTGTSKTNTGNMIGRAVVGNFVAGVPGMLIGGTTAKQDTTTISKVSQENDVVRHNYTVWISVKDLANPLIKINYDWDVDKANETVALMNAIIASYRNTNQ